LTVAVATILPSVGVGGCAVTSHGEAAHAWDSALSALVRGVPVVLTVTDVRYVPGLQGVLAETA
jgi:hypothetical protein